MKKIVLVSTLLFVMSLYAEPDMTNTNTNKTVKSGWNLAEVKKEPTGDSCEDGKCGENLNCFKKDGPMNRFFRVFRDNVKKHCHRK